MELEEDNGKEGKVKLVDASCTSPLLLMRETCVRLCDGHEDSPSSMGHLDESS